jgi:glycosyltransferase involved in cell wall biosynthesis
MHGLREANGVGMDAGLPGDLLARADALRDARSWPEAARAYAEVLAAAPLSWPIMVQRGHCLKEAGELDGALAMYRQAEALAPDDSDVALQIGHALKLLGRRAEAASAYARAVRLDPMNPDARREAEALDALPAAVPPASAVAPAPTPIAAAAPDAALIADAGPAAYADAPGATLAAPIVAPARAALPAPLGDATAVPQLVLDITDLLDHFRRRRTPTGIQRVQIRLSAELMAAPPPGTELRLAVFAPARLGWVRVPEDACRRLLDLSAAGADEADPDWAEAVAAMERIRATAPPLGFRDGAVLSPLGGLWAYADWFRALAEARRAATIRLIPFLHDCVPLLLPETCQDGTVANYAAWFAGFARMGDGYVCNSEATRTDVAGELARLSPALVLPSRAVRLDGDPRPAVPAGPAPMIPGLAPGEPYVLAVGTIEPRKDHAMLFRAWRALARRHGAATPRLVCAGRIGWRAEAALELLASSPELRRHVLLVERVSDSDLAALYRGALFTVANSLHEGWGLPVTESLAHGRVPLIPRVGALPESGGPHAAYFAPGSEAELIAGVERLLADPAARVLPPVALRSWGEVARDLSASIAAVAAACAPADRGLPQAGPEWRFARGDAQRPDVARADAALLREGPGWDAPEPWGVRARPGPARLSVPLPPGAEGAALRLALVLRGADVASGVMIRVVVEGAAPVEATAELAAGVEETLLLDLPAVGRGPVAVVLDSASGVGLSSLLLCRADDLAARLAFLEARRFGAAR